jgi:hypothetical protein
MRHYRSVCSSLFAIVLAGCASSGFAERPIPQILEENVGQPVGRLQEALGEPRKVDRSAANPVYVWFIPQAVEGASAGLHGCEMEVTVDARSQQVLGFSLSNIGWSKCRQISRRIRVASR